MAIMTTKRSNKTNLFAKEAAMWWLFLVESVCDLCVYRVQCCVGAVFCWKPCCCVLVGIFGVMKSVSNVFSSTLDIGVSRVIGL